MDPAHTGRSSPSESRRARTSSIKPGLLAYVPPGRPRPSRPSVTLPARVTRLRHTRQTEARNTTPTGNCSPHSWLSRQSPPSVSPRIGDCASRVLKKSRKSTEERRNAGSPTDRASGEVADDLPFRPPHITLSSRSGARLVQPPATGAVCRQTQRRTRAPGALCKFDGGDNPGAWCFGLTPSRVHC